MDPLATRSSSIDVWTLSQGICDACLDGEYQNCYCNTVDTIEFTTNYKQTKNMTGYSRETLNSSGSFTNSVNGEFISDNEFDDFVDLKTSDVLPPPTTNWKNIDSVLSDKTLVESDVDKDDSTLNTPKGPKMQMAFVDCESDKESTPDVEVYYEDDRDFLKRSTGSTGSFFEIGKDRDLDSRDSGFVTNDIYEMNIEYVTDTPPRRGSLEPAEISTRVLASLQLEEECEKKRKKEIEEKRTRDNEYKNKLNKKTIEELKILKQTLEMRIAEVNLDLMEQLAHRDDLHSQHQALLMDADDIAQSSPCQNNNEETPTSSPNKKVSQEVASPSKSSKRRSFWFR